MQLTEESNVIVLAVPGPALDAGASKSFKSKVGPIAETTSKLVIDMSSVKFVDSSGLGAILSCLRQLNAKGGEMRIFGLSKPVRSLFELVRMHRVVDIYNTREEALAAFKQ